MMKKVGILTFHRAHNYGAMLQAYALCETLQSLNYQCEIINYKSSSIDNAYKKDSLIDLIKKEGLYDGLLTFADHLCHGYYFDIRSYRFRSFLKHTLSVSKVSYTNSSQLRKSPYQAFVFGSDQIWNKKITKGFDPVYFGRFVPKGKKKIAYAASAGLNKLPEADKEKFRQLLKDYDFIGTREEYLREELVSLGLPNVDCVLDPTLLLSGDKWRSSFISKRIINEKYILLYQVIKDNRLSDIAKRLSEQKGYKVIEITYKYDLTMKEFTQKTTYGPKEFLNLIYFSEYVVTSSFHGTCFSILFHKQFYSYLVKGNDERLCSVLTKLGLEDRIVRNYQDAGKKTKIDYSAVEKRIRGLRQRSISLLADSLSKYK